jgi:hypothetical protein
MKTVREVFSKAFGDVPEGATCHAGYGNAGVTYLGESIKTCDPHTPSLKVPVRKTTGDFEWLVFGTYGFPKTPDISDRDAEAFRGFFGAEYDNALDQLQEAK